MEESGTAALDALSELRRKNLMRLIGPDARFKRKADFARAIDRAPAYVNNILGGKNIGEKVARYIERKLELEPLSLDREYDEERLDRSELVLIRGEPLLRRVPIVGHAIATPDEDGFFDDMGFPTGSGEGYVLWLTRDANAYALRVKGHSMAPRYRPGELIIVLPGAAVSPGSDVLVRARSGRKMLKQLLYKRRDEVTLGSVNQTFKPVTLLLEEIDSMHLVVPGPADLARE